MNQAELQPLLTEFAADRLALLLRHEAAARAVSHYDFNNTYQYVISREETHLQWLQTALAEYGAQLPPPFDVIYGASHAFDLPFAFGNFGPSLYANISYTRANEAGRLALSDAMMRSIGAFARTGDPNHPALGVTWPTWPSMLLFDATPAAKAISVR